MSVAYASLLMFQVGARCFAAPVAAIARIHKGKPGSDTNPVQGTALGTPLFGKRGLTVAVDGRNRTLVVDQVLGVRSVPAGDLRAMPAVAGACLRSRAVTGLVLLEELLTVVVDLEALIREADASAGPKPDPRPTEEMASHAQ
jgi:chemotaxis signal transduction protein